MLKNLLSPFLISVYPALFLYSRFYLQTEVSSFLLTLAISLVTLLIVTLLSYFISKKWSNSSHNYAQKLSLMITMIMFIFLIYGHAFSVINQTFMNGVVALGQHNFPTTFFKIFINVLLSTLALLLIYLWSKFTKNLGVSACQKLSTTILIFLFILVASPLLSITKHIIESKIITLSSTKANSATHNSSKEKIGSTACEFCDSDIYLIVLDGYARNDTLQEFYNYDNSPFLNQLKDKGFQVFDKASANYGITFLSLASTLNLNYIDAFFEPDIKLSSTDFLPLVRNSFLANNLKQKGYKYLHLSSTYGPTMQSDSANEVHNCHFGWLKNDFLRVYIEGTFLTVFNASAVSNLAKCYLQNFDWLSNVAATNKEKKFVFAHIIMPHHPYLFNSQGEILRDANLSDQFQYQKLLWADRTAYTEQLKFLNKTIASAVDKIKKHSNKPPLIIIMSDHGPQLIDKKGKQNSQYSQGRASILLSIHTPNQKTDLDIPSSVNIFRVIFNEYFNEEYEILPNVYYHSHYSKPFVFKENLLD